MTGGKNESMHYWSQGRRFKAAIQIRRLDSKAQVDIFSKRTSLGRPPCEMPLVIDGTIAAWDELIRGFRKDSLHRLIDKLGSGGG